MLQIKGGPDLGGQFLSTVFFCCQKTKEVFSRLVNIMWAHGTLELLAVHSYCPNGQELKRAANLKFPIFPALILSSSEIRRNPWQHIKPVNNMYHTRQNLTDRAVQ